MTPYEIALQKRILTEKAELVYDNQMPLSRNVFLHDIWHAISSFTFYNKRDPLVADAVLRCNYLIPWGYTILTVLYGAYTYEPTKFQVMKDYIRLLDHELCEDELRAMDYARTKGEQVFYPGLNTVLSKIHDLYGRSEFPSDSLPPRPYHAYVFIALNHHDIIRETATLQEYFDYLEVDHARMEQFLSKVRRPCD